MIASGQLRHYLLISVFRVCGILGDRKAASVKVELLSVLKLPRFLLLQISTLLQIYPFVYSAEPETRN